MYNCPMYSGGERESQRKRESVGARERWMLHVGVSTETCVCNWHLGTVTPQDSATHHSVIVLFPQNAAVGKDGQHDKQRNEKNE